MFSGRQSLALPDRAWSGRPLWKYFLSGALVLYGVLVASAAGIRGGVELAVGLILLAKGLIWISLSFAVWCDFSSMIRKGVALLIALSGIQFLVPLLLDMSYAKPWWISVPISMILGTVGVGVWFARTWGPRACTILGVATCAYTIVTGGISFPWSHQAPQLGVLEIVTMIATGILLGIPIVFGPAAALAVYGSLPATRGHFAEARETMAHARGGPS